MASEKKGLLERFDSSQNRHGCVELLGFWILGLWLLLVVLTGRLLRRFCWNWPWSIRSWLGDSAADGISPDYSTPSVYSPWNQNVWSVLGPSPERIRFNSLLQHSPIGEGLEEK